MAVATSSQPTLGLHIARIHAGTLGIFAMQVASLRHARGIAVRSSPLSSSLQPKGHMARQIQAKTARRNGWRPPPSVRRAIARGWITSSMYPRDAAINGFANLSRNSAVFSARSAVFGMFALVEKAAGNVPATLERLDGAPRKQHTAVADHQRAGAGFGVPEMLGAAGGASLRVMRPRRRRQRTATSRAKLKVHDSF